VLEVAVGVEVGGAPEGAPPSVGPHEATKNHPTVSARLVDISDVYHAREGKRDGPPGAVSHSHEEERPTFMSKSTRLRWVVSGLGLSLAFLVSPRPGAACEHSMQIELSPRQMALSQARPLADQGYLSSASRMALGVLPKDAVVGKEIEVDRLLGVEAIAVVRSGGRLNQDPAASPEARAPERAIEAALRTLEAIAAARPQDTLAKVDVAEALSRLPGRRDEALRVLEDLERKNVLPSAWGYAALARLRTDPAPEAPGWVAGPLAALGASPAQLSRGRCRAMTRDDAICAEVVKTEAAPSVRRFEERPKRVPNYFGASLVKI
jgi:hypothetical protein